jgi:hypothetical protein
MVISSGGPSVRAVSSHSQTLSSGKKKKKLPPPPSARRHHHPLHSQSRTRARSSLAIQQLSWGNRINKRGGDVEIGIRARECDVGFGIMCEDLATGPARSEEKEGPWRLPAAGPEGDVTD